MFVKRVEILISKTGCITFIVHVSHLSHRQLLSTGPSGLILSTDDFFAHREGYNYEARLLGEAHDWNHNRSMFCVKSHCVITKAFLSNFNQDSLCCVSVFRHICSLVILVLVLSQCCLCLQSGGITEVTRYLE